MTQSPGDSTKIRAKLGELRRPSLIILGVNALLLALAYRAFLFPDTRHFDLDHELESWFFLGGEGSGAIVLVLAAWVLYRRWPRLRQIPHRPGSPVVIGLCFAAAAALLGWAVYARSANLLAPSLALTGLGLAALRGGGRACATVALPLVMLLFAVPLPPPLYNAIVWPTQLWAAQYAGWMLETIGIEATVSADLIFRDRHVLSVIEGCSGLRSAEILMLLSLFMKELFRLRTWETWALVLLSPLLAFFLNGLRVAGIALLPNPDEAIQHTGQGILTLVGGCLLLFGIVLAMEKLRSRERAAPEAPASKPEPSQPSRTQLAWSTALIIGLVILSYAIPASRPLPRTPIDLAELIPAQVGRLESTDLEVHWRFLGNTLFRKTLHRRYERPGAPKGTEIVLFAGVGARDDTRFSSLSPKTAVPGAGWVEEERSRRESTIGEATLDVVVARAGTARRVVYRYTANDLGLAREVARSISGVDATPRRDAEDEIVVRLSTPLRNGSTAARRQSTARLANFARALHEPLSQLLGGAPVPDEPPQVPAGTDS
jgi:exosortase